MPKLYPVAWQSQRRGRLPLEYLTDFADQAVMLPMAALVALGLAVSGWRRGLLAWLVAITGVLGTMALLKFIFFACAGVLGNTGIYSPSGHTAASAAIYGGALMLLLQNRAPTAALVVMPPLIAVVFGISRLAVGAHDFGEVLVGGAVGLAGVACLAILAGPRPSVRLWPVAVAAVAVMVACHGLRLQAEGMVHNFALFQWLPLPTVCRT